MITKVSERLLGIRGPILTIDGSLAQTGWALTDESGRRLQSGVFRSSSGPGWPADHRIYAIGVQLMQLWPKLLRRPMHFGIEHQFFRPGAPGAKFQLRPEVVADLARLEGVCIFVAKNADPGIDVLALRSTEWRALLGVKSERNKKGAFSGDSMKARGIAESVKRLRDAGARCDEIEDMYDDEIEAIGLGMAIHHELTHGYPMHSRREELKTEKKAKRARAKLPKLNCGFCHKRMLKPGMMVDHLTGPMEVHIKCRKPAALK